MQIDGISFINNVFVLFFFFRIFYMLIYKFQYIFQSLIRRKRHPTSLQHSYSRINIRNTKKKRTKTHETLSKSSVRIWLSRNASWNAVLQCVHPTLLRTDWKNYTIRILMRCLYITSNCWRVLDANSHNHRDSINRSIRRVFLFGFSISFRIEIYIFFLFEFWFRENSRKFYCIVGFFFSYHLNAW